MPSENFLYSEMSKFLKFLFICSVCSLILIEPCFSGPPQYPCKPPNHNSYPFCDTSLSIRRRAQTLVSFLNLEEKIQQLSDNASGISRLGIPPYEWWSESLHGIASNGPGISFNGSIRSATSFPQVILTAASFNRSLWHSIASAIAVEARAMYNAGQAGLTFWAPNINIFRDPRWGRGQETPGEDPMVASAYAIEYVKGFQGQNPTVIGGSKNRLGVGSGGRRFLKDDTVTDDGDGRLMLSACCKHFIAYDLEKWRNNTRYNFSAVVSLSQLKTKTLVIF